MRSPMFTNPKANVLFEDIEGAAQLAGELHLHAISGVLFIVMACMIHPKKFEMLQKLNAKVKEFAEENRKEFVPDE